MKKAGAIVGIVGGVLSLAISALVTAVIGDYTTVPMQGGSFPKEYELVCWLEILLSVLAIVFGAVAFTRQKAAGFALIIISISGGLLGGVLVPVLGFAGAGSLVTCMLVSLVGGTLAIIRRGA